MVLKFIKVDLTDQYGTFELRILSEFYRSNDVIVGHISLPHDRETVKSMYISCLFQIVLSHGVKGIVCMKRIVKFIYMKTHLMIFFPEMLIEKNLGDMSMFFGEQLNWLYPAISRDIFILKIPKFSPYLQVELSSRFFLI